MTKNKKKYVLRRKILNDFEWQILKEINKPQGKTRSHFRDSKRFLKTQIQAQNLLERILTKCHHNFSEAEKFIDKNIAPFKMSNDTIAKYYYQGRAFRKLWKTIDKVEAQGAITREENRALKRILRSSMIHEKKHPFNRLLKEAMEFKIKKNKRVEQMKEEEETGKEVWLTDEEFKLKQLLPSQTARPKSALEPFEKAGYRTYGKGVDGKRKPLGKEGKRVKKLLEDYEGK